jgi:hypothetical protein
VGIGRGITMAVSATLAGAVLVPAGATSGLAATRTPPSAGPKSCVAHYWGTTGTGGDIAGAYTRGNRCELDDGRIMIDGDINDTKGDGQAACAQFHATYSSGGTRDEWVYVAGTGNSKHFSYVFASSVRQIWVREGLGNGGHCTTMANGVHVIF